mmetsp:Transcript_32216/g.55642  ORF Transcript_32216/g.55642 Transcript_32216/m.55642 type:complete len:135 (-) Transcript_32216:291-695(-)
MEKEETEFDEMLSPLLNEELIEGVFFLDRTGQKMFSNESLACSSFVAEEGINLVGFFRNESSISCSSRFTFCGKQFQIFQKTALCLQAIQQRTGYGLIARSLIAGTLIILYRPAFHAPSIFSIVEDFCCRILSA